MGLCLHGVHICPIPFHRGRCCQCACARRAVHMGLGAHVTTMCKTTVPTASPTRPVTQQATKSSGKHNMAQGPQNDSTTQMHSHPGSSHMTTLLQETDMEPQPHRRQPYNHSHLGHGHTRVSHTTATMHDTATWQQSHNHSHVDRPQVTQPPETRTGPQSQQEYLLDPQAPLTTHRHTQNEDYRDSSPDWQPEETFQPPIQRCRRPEAQRPQ